MKRGDMPPDPWAEEGIDVWSLEQAEELTRHKADPDDPRWERVEGPTTDEFDDAENEEHGAGSLPTPAVVFGIVAIAVALYVSYIALR